MKGDVAFDLLHYLMDVAVQDRHGSKPLEIRERAFAILRSPSPLGIHRPERDVRKDDDGRAAFEALDVLLEPFELVGPEQAEASSFEVDHIHETDEVNTAVV